MGKKTRSKSDGLTLPLLLDAIGQGDDMADIEEPEEGQDNELEDIDHDGVRIIALNDNVS